MFIQRLRMGGLLSFPPDMEFFELQPLNVLIGPNASGKSNFIEVLELLRATPTDFAAAIRDGGGAKEWLWKGDDRSSPATIEVETGPSMVTGQPLRYRLSFTTTGLRVHILDEAIEEATHEGVEPYFYYTFQQGRPVINIRVRDTGRTNGRENGAVGRTLAGSIRPSAAQGSGPISGTLLARMAVSANPNVPRVDVRSLRCATTAAARRSSGEMATSRLQQSGLGAQPD